MSKKFNLHVNNSFEFNLESEAAQALDLLKLNEANFHLIHKHQSFNVKLENANFQAKQYTISINSNVYTVNIASELDLFIKKMGFTTNSAKKEKRIKAPMPGIILQINVKEGAKIKEGETLLILEAMKMENAITSPIDGTVKTISVSNGDTVEKGKLLIELS
ncbi:acetyl-CoA carboxylase biotin carboxyl carrier protein subunit [Lutibacter sp.]